MKNCKTQVKPVAVPCSLTANTLECDVDHGYKYIFIGSFFMVYLVYSSILSSVSVPVQDGFLKPKTKKRSINQ